MLAITRILRIIFTIILQLLEWIDVGKLVISWL